MARACTKATEAASELDDLDFRLEKYLVKVLGQGDKTFFWKDRWLCDSALKDMFPRLYSMESSKKCLVLDRVVAAGSNVEMWD
ncbi:hypothetical protein L2E82_08058 [Cichorium intybus]|uniref:Uncharacterized protein n=1 Tax=Cichorium intybus TaxID=13427 RepID=A0ACB9G6J0_CICIN|nr:hypothetical protein L2E82_08058 [Cichorium intybus]